MESARIVHVASLRGCKLTHRCGLCLQPCEGRKGASRNNPTRRALKDPATAHNGLRKGDAIRPWKVTHRPTPTKKDSPFDEKLVRAWMALSTIWASGNSASLRNDGSTLSQLELELSFHGSMWELGA